MSTTPDPHEQLLALYLDERLTLLDIAFTLGLSLRDTIARTQHPDFITLLTTYSDAQDKRADLLLRASRPAIIRSLTRIARTADDPDPARKAASDLARMQATPKPNEITHDLLIRAINAYNKNPGNYTRALLAPILGPAPPHKQAA